MSRVAFVVNQGLVRDPAGFARRCREAAARHGWEPWFADTRGPADGLAQTRRAAAAGAGLVVAAGGDGTVRACAQALADRGVPLAIVPLGTANLTARALGVPARQGPALRAAFTGRDRKIDLARTGEGAVFAVMAGIGLDAAVVEGTSQALKRRLGWVAYAVAGLARLRQPPARFTVRLDGGPPLRRTARTVVVANAGLLPGGFALLPGARLDDGRLDVGILAPSGPWGWPLAAARVLARRPAVERFGARRAEISADTELARQADGEILAPGRALSVSVCPGALVVRLPR